MVDAGGLRHVLIRNLIAAGAYGAVAALPLILVGAGTATPIWPAAGVAFALAYRWRAQILPGVFLGAVAGNLLTLPGTGVTGWPTASVVFGLAAAGAAYVGAALVRGYVGSRTPLDVPSDILLFLTLSGPVAAVVTATVGTVTQIALGWVPAGQAASAWLVWWVGDAIGIIVFGPLTLMLLPDQRDIWNGRRWQVAVPTVLVTALLVGLVVGSGSLERARVEEARAAYAADAAEHLQQRLDLHAEVLEGIKGLYLSSEAMTATEYQTFTETTLLPFPSVQAISWAPVVRESERSAFETDQRQRPGLNDYRLFERDAEGRIVTAAARPVHVPVMFTAPLAQNQAALGFDLASETARAEAIIEATDTGRPTATGLVQLVQEGGPRPGLLVFSPTYQQPGVPKDAQYRREQIAGFAVGVYRTDEILAALFGAPRWDTTALRLFDVTTEDEPTLLAERRAPAEPATDPSEGTSGVATTVEFDQLGRKWALEVTPVTGDLALAVGGVNAPVLLAALVAVFLFETLILLLTGITRRARRDALEKSYEATHDALTGAVNRRGFVEQLGRLCAEAESERAAHVLLYADLDRFKDVNDRAGHDVGDRMLMLVAEAMRTCVRGADTLARIGGDEFAIILRECTIPVAVRTAEAIVEAIRAVAIESPSGSLTVGVSVGLAPFGYGWSTEADSVLREADWAAYAAKRDPDHAIRVALREEERSEAPDVH